MFFRLWNTLLGILAPVDFISYILARNFFQEGIYCNAKFHCYADFPIVFRQHLGGQKSLKGTPLLPSPRERKPASGSSIHPNQMHDGGYLDEYSVK